MTPSNKTASEGHAPLPAQLMRMPVVMRFTGLGRSTIYRLIAEDRFPKPVQLSDRAVGWRLADLQDWSSARPTASH